jgi:hypothetical protein
MPPPIRQKTGGRKKRERWQILKITATREQRSWVILGHAAFAQFFENSIM